MRVRFAGIGTSVAQRKREMLAEAAQNCIVGWGSIMQPPARRKYTVENLLPALRLAVKHRQQMLRHISDNTGAIHSVARILEFMCIRICFPEMGHLGQYSRRAQAEISVAAYAAQKRGEPVHTEHVMPQRAFAKAICELIEDGVSDAMVIHHIRTNFRLVTLTPEERRKLDALNRTEITEDRIADAGIKLRRVTRSTKAA